MAHLGLSGNFVLELEIGMNLHVVQRGYIRDEGWHGVSAVRLLLGRRIANPDKQEPHVGAPITGPGTFVDCGNVLKKKLNLGRSVTGQRSNQLNYVPSLFSPG